MKDPLPLTPAQTREVLERLGPLTTEMILVGGQALAFWAERYNARVPDDGPVNSFDIDFSGTAEQAIACAKSLEGTAFIPDPFEPTPNTGLVRFVDPSGTTRTMDFISTPFGLDEKDVAAMAIDLDLADGVALRVMHPIHCLESRACNVSGLPAYNTPLGLRQLRVSIVCARAYLVERLEAGDSRAVRSVLDLDERIFHFTLTRDHARNVWIDHEIDCFEAVLVDDRLPEAFRDRRFPQMCERLARVRRRWRSPSE